MEKQYCAREVEERWLKVYGADDFFRADVANLAPPFVMVIPPPNVTGVLHIGHALNNTIQDVLIRKARLSGFNTLWVPGTDHAGIATQNVVERSLLEKGLKREDLGRERFLQEVWKWKEEHGSTIIEQLKRLGCSCDWSRERFTMDAGLSNAVATAFVSLFQKGLIYRGNYIVNWCPRCTTALANEEVAYEEEEGHLYYIRYPGTDGSAGVVVATTRPETLFGDTAVAVNPKDSRYRKMVGKKVLLPILHRAIPIVSHPMVDKGFGTGAVKVTPHHDANDFKIAKDLALPGITVIDEKGILTKEAGPFCGMERFAGRQATIALLKEDGLLERIEEYRHRVGRCYRCETVVEPYLSRQWFVRMKPLAEPALELARKGKPTFLPRRWQKVYQAWLENIEDWCISRQIWWGHRLPVYYCQECQEKEEEEGKVVVSKENPRSCPYCGSTKLIPEEDVLDTWFSSWLWPFSVMGWPEETLELKVFYPTHILVTAPEIIFFWVARMVMASLHFTGKLPFSQVYIHGTVRDETGRKMSKSYGNVIDPLQVIAEVGADALRFSLVSFAGQGQDLFIGRKSFTLGRNFANKIWNAARLIIGRAEEIGYQTKRLPAFSEMSPSQRWILSELEATQRRVEKGYADLRLNEVATHLYQFFWHTYCDWYLEMVKVDQEEEEREDSLGVALFVFNRFLHLLHPIMPFLTEELFSRLKEKNLIREEGEYLARSSWPKSISGHYQARLNKRFRLLQEAITTLRDLKREFDIPANQPVFATICLPDREMEFFSGTRKYLLRLAGLSEARFVSEHRRQKMEASRLFSCGEVFLPLSGLFDAAKEKAKLEKELTAIEKELDKIKTRLSDKQFLNKAPAEVVSREKERQKQLMEKQQKIHQNLSFLNE